MEDDQTIDSNHPDPDFAAISTGALMSDDAKAIFDKYDTDGSGLISFDEFRDMLPEFGINISLPKMRKYFRFCDSDDSGEIDLEEFRVSLFLSDPQGNPMGFSPNSLLSPKDAFDMFDSDQSGKLDEDEFFFLLQYLEVNVSEEEQDRMFHKYDTDKSGFIEYNEFRKIWVRIGNTKKELIDRNITIPKFATNAQLVGMLERVLDKEEEEEKRALAEADRWRKWQSEIRVRKTFITKAKQRAQAELRMAMDAAGQVYVFGKGTLNQFSQTAKEDMSSSSFNLEGQKELQTIWNRRIGAAPNVEQLFEGIMSKKESIQINLREDKKSPHVVKNLDKSENLSDKSVNNNTIALWGRRPRQIAISENVMFCLCDSGQIYAWGGNDPWWHELEPDSHWQTHWRGDSTARSKKLLCTEKLPLRETGIPVEEENNRKEIKKLKMIAQYYGCWRSPTGIEDSLDFIQKKLIPSIRFESVKFSLDVRGKPCEGLTKLEMMDILYDDISFEISVLGEQMHRKIRDLELEILDLIKRKKNTLAKRLRLEISKIWGPLRDMQVGEKSEEITYKMKDAQKKMAQREKDYDKWTNHLEVQKGKAKEFTPRGRNINIRISGITPRGNSVHTPRGYAKALHIAAGTNHASLIHQNGDLYVWGMGAAGRLGLDDSEGGNTRADANHPTLVTSLKGKQTIRVSCGQSHSAAICSEGELYMWGSCQTGKLGLGTFTKDEECYCSIPTRLRIPQVHSITRVSCGTGHTACIGNGGELFVWGCGNGGRLGLGSKEMRVQYIPRLLEYLMHEKFVDVSCGHYQTIAITKIDSQTIGNGQEKIETFSGGEMYVAGPANVLGMNCFKFERYDCLMQPSPIFSAKRTLIQQVSAGFRHQSAITIDGELLCWGNNVDGCCGQKVEHSFIHEPTKVSCFSQPYNIALNKPCKTSSVYGNQNPSLAVDGNVGGSVENLVHTQVDAQPFCEIDLEDFAVIGKINIWNRTDEALTMDMQKDAYSRRLFPCWVMVSQLPFPDGIGGDNLKKSVDTSIANFRLTENKRLSTIYLPRNIIGRYIRVQLEKFDMLHLAQIEIFGTYDIFKPGGEVSFTSAGKNVTAAVIKAVDDPTDINSTFRRAAMADIQNAAILGQFDTYLEVYNAFRCQEKRKNSCETICSLCTGTIFCEICLLRNRYKEEIESVEKETGRILTIEEISEYLMQIDKPTLDYKPKSPKSSSYHAVLQRLKTVSSNVKKNFSTNDEENGI